MNEPYLLQREMDVYILEVYSSLDNLQQVIFPVVLANQEEKLLVDCGDAGCMLQLEKALHEHGLSSRNLTGIIITHHDNDHLGALLEARSARQ